MITARTVAQFFLAFSNECQELTTNLKLNHLVYYTQAWHLAVFNKPLFDERIEAWVHGPVVPCLYEEYKKYGNFPILEDYPDSNEIKQQFSSDQQTLLNDIIEVYFPQDEYELELRTFRSDPWRHARAGLYADEPSHNKITRKSMQRFYAGMLAEENKDEKSSKKRKEAKSA